MKDQNFEQLHIVVCALDRLVDNAISNLAALDAYEQIFSVGSIPSTQLEFLSQSSFALRDCITIAVAAIFEEDETCRNKNCSLGEMQCLLKEDNKFNLSLENRSAILERIDALMQKYTGSGIEKLRNKSKAHYDLVEFFVKNRKEASVKTLKALLLGTRSIMVDFFDKWIGVSIAWEDYDNRVSRFKQSILSCIN